MKAHISRAILAVSLLVGSAFALPHAAQAHASLVKCNIARNARLRVPPKQLVCTFAEGVNPKGSMLDIVATDDGGVLNTKDAQVSFSNAKQMTVGMPKLSRGTYGVLWYTISADDGHHAGGYFTFSIIK